MEKQKEPQENSHAPYSPWMNTEQAAIYIGSTPNTMRTWRGRGEGPKSHCVSHRFVRYHRDDLDAFIRGESSRN